ncbi:chaperone DnaJ-domain superfamily protein [Actinidia rufa]|uniref:Chaperone DnaJ-domain superfamily protein n=1 Tax=Actinidia rufa TaxID=165716 RepID=A0A7J0DLE3_9ERIC|nr:chaperone DnaJ-domain superfamily protein [Actinidia rufa]
MSDLKSQTKFSNGGSNFGINSGFDAKPTSGNRPKSAYNSNSRNGSFDVDLDGFFRSGNDRKATNSGDFDGFDDVFGGPIMASKPSGGDGFDFDSVLTGSSNISNNDDDDVFGVFKSSTKVHNDAVFGSMGSFSNPSAPVGDLLGNFGGMGLGSNGLKKKSGKVEKNDSGFDDLIPGFGRSPSRNGTRYTIRCFKAEKTLELNKLLLDAHPTRRRASPTTNIGDDFSFLFGAAPSASSGVFQEIEGESEERRRARLNHHMRTQQRMAKALAEKNQRDFQTQQDQEERHRIAETLDNNIKRWAAGKEGNLRALLSSLQSVQLDA